jgi:arylformamidase
VAWAEHEAAEFYRQSQEFSSALKLTGKLTDAMVGKGLNHFELIETLADPGSPLGRAALNMLT